MFKAYCPILYCRCLLVKTSFWLLDISPKITDESTEVWLWGIDPAGKRVLVIDRTFIGYFYCVTAEGFEPSKLAEQITKNFADSVVKAEVAQRKFFGQPVAAIKVYCGNPSGIGEVAKRLRGFEGVKECFEDDIRVSMRYLIDNNVVPCTWHEAEVEEDANILGVRAD